MNIRSRAPTCALLLALLAVVPLAAQQRQIRGLVTGPDGQPLANAYVVVPATGAAATTDVAGRFTIEVPAGEAVLQLTNLGYLTRNVTVPAGESTVTIALEIDVLDLEGIVVTGQATSVARRNLANAVATVTTREVEEAPPAESIEKIMQGKVAGALIETNSGAPGGGVQVRLRGVSTVIGENEPLYVVDGVVVSNVAIASNANAVTQASGGSNPALTQDAVVNRAVDLNPNDIERIEILKGASAAALYGSRASNGVILITTKRGVPGAPRFSLTQRVGTFVRSNELGARNWTRDEAVAAFGSGAAEFFNADGSPIQVFDHEDQLAGRSELSSETVLSVSGGDEDTRYFISGTVKDDEGIIANTGFEKQGVRVNLHQEFGDRFRLTANTNLLHTLAQRGLTNNDNSGTSYYMVLPFTPNFFDLSPGADGQYPDNLFERSNPLETAALAQNDEDVWRFIAGGTAELDAYERDAHRISLLGTVGVDFFAQQNDLYFPPELQFEPADGLPGTSLLSNSDNMDLTMTAHLIHNYTSPGGLNATLTAGVQYEDRDLNTARIEAYGLTAGQPNRDAGVVQQIREQRQVVRDLGFFAQEEVLLRDERVLLTAGLRADRSSVNGDPNQYFFYPKAAASYRFDALTDWLDGLKLRVAYGQSGNQPQYGQKFTPLTATTNIEGLPGLVVQGVAGDAGLQPERQSEIEGGFDATLFDSSVLFEATVFQKNISDLLLQRTLAPSTGFATQIFNGGELRVRGLELALSATPIRTGDFRWISRTTFYGDRSEVTSLPVPAFETGGFGTSLGAFRIEEGASATQIVANAGLDADGNIIVAKVGDANPDFRIGFANDLEFGRFQLSSLVDWSKGNAVINLTQFLADAGANSVDFKANPQPLTLADGTVVQLGAGERRITRRGNLRDSRGYIEDGSYVKVREVTLGYELPVDLFQRIAGPALQTARLSLSGRNLLTFTDYLGLDPEVSNFGNQSIARNIDVAPFPPSRSFWLSVDLVF
ncbi:MAG: SusC/RagA family TonB-linked outer membrane protein [Longimicrobiales bacterium]